MNLVYEGIFENGKKHGEGKLYIENGSYKLESKFIDDHAEYEANQVFLKLP